MLHEEILEQIDNISNEMSNSEIAVIESMIDFYDKQCNLTEGGDTISIYQESKSEEKGIISQIWNAIKRFIKAIIDGFKKAINNFTNKATTNSAGNKPVRSVSEIAADVLSHGKNIPDNIDAWPVPQVNPKYVVTESYTDDIDYLSTFLEAAEINESDIPSDDNIPQKVRIDVDPKSEIKGGSVELKKNTINVSYINNHETLRISYFGFGKFSKTKIKSDDPSVLIPGQDKEWYSSPKVALHLMTHDDTRNKITELVMLALRVIKHRKPEDINEIKKADKMKKIVKIFLTPEHHVYEVPVAQLTAVQSWASKLLTEMEAFTSTDVKVSDLDPETIKSLNMVVRLLMRIQISLNYISSALNNMHIIDRSFYSSIKSIELLDEFVGKCIEAGLPPKFVAYNAWLISNECIRGNGEYKPIFGHARATLFPPNQKIVLKIALSGLGTVSNETESRFTKIFIDMDRIDLIAPVIKDFRNNAIIAMERVNGNFDLSSKVLKEYSKKANDALKEYQEKTGKKLNIKVGSQHIGNVAFDNKYKVYRSIDYGVHYRESK